MRKIYIFYLLCVGVSLTFLSTYFSFVFPEYTNSVFYIVTVILLSSIILLMFLEDRIKSFTNKLLVMSSFFLILYFAIIISENLYVLTLFGQSIVNIFTKFFLMCSIVLMLVSSISLKDDSVFANKYLIAVVFLPIIIYSFWILFNSYSFSVAELLSKIELRVFMLAFTIIYTSLILYNIIADSYYLLTVKQKYIIMSIGISILLLSSGFREAGFFIDLSSLFSVVGCFVLCISLMIESSLNLHTYIIYSLVDNLKGRKKKAFLKYLKRVSSKDKDLLMHVTDYVRIKNNPGISNIEEKTKYTALIASSYKWYKKNVRGSSNYLKQLKHFYNTQVFLTKKMKNFLM